MRTEEINFNFTVHASRRSLQAADAELLDQAMDAITSAYAPYSNFKVGSAIRTAKDMIIKGSNQENGSFPVGQCAERVALYNMIHHHGREPIDTIAIVVDHHDQIKPASPCGSCRQLLTEYRNGQTQPIRLILAAAHGEDIYELKDIRDLLPLSFDGTFLGV